MRKDIPTSKHRIKSMALVHEMLYASDELNEIDFEKYISSLVKGLEVTSKSQPGKIDFEINAENVLLEINPAIYCGLIINELVSNSLKYAFPDKKKGKVRISFRINNDGEKDLLVSDNGIGIPENIDIKKTKSLGLHLVSILAEEQLRGKLTLIREGGSTFRIRFK